MNSCRVLGLSARCCPIPSWWSLRSAAAQGTFTMLMGINGMNNGINYDPMNPMGTHSWRKDAKAANRIAGLVTK
jgi:hypothetical protein